MVRRASQRRGATRGGTKATRGEPSMARTHLLTRPGRRGTPRCSSSLEARRDERADEQRSSHEDQCGGRKLLVRTAVRQNHSGVGARAANGNPETETRTIGEMSSEPDISRGQLFGAVDPSVDNVSPSPAQLVPGNRPKR